MAERTRKTVALGSGYTHILAYTGTLPGVKEIITQCTDDTRFGTTTGGASITYTAETHKEEDDLGEVCRIITTKEEVKYKTGIFSWAPGMLEKLVATYRTETKDGYKISKIGGLANDDGKKYIVVFHHIDKSEGDLWCIIVGTNTAGFALAFAKDNVTKLEPEFTALPSDDEGTLVIIAEETATPTGGQTQDDQTDGG